MLENETRPVSGRTILGVSARNWYLTIGMGIVVVLSYLPMFMSLKIIRLFTREDHIYENIGASFFFLTGVLFLVAFFRTRKSREPRLKRLSYLALAVLFVFFAGEEISWGQRIFGIKSSEFIEEVNRQEETNLHNLKWVAGEDAVIPLNIEQIFLLFATTFGFGVPVISQISKRARHFFDRFMPILPWFLGTLTVLNYLVQKGLCNLFERFPDWYPNYNRPPAAPIYEIREYCYAIILLALAAYYVFVTLRDAAAAQEEIASVEQSMKASAS